MYLHIKGHKIRISATSAMHYWKLFARSALFLLAVFLYIFGKMDNRDILFGSLEKYPAVVFIITIIFAVEMILRFFPDGIESMGCQKQFDRNYIPVKSAVIDRKALIKKGNKGVLLTLFSWIALNGCFFVLYYLDIIDSGILLLISLAYSVCDMICILFFCPFQVWFLGNKCCGSCRIYNWDYAMMFTPLLVVKNIYGYILIVLSLILFIRWELFFRMYPERFFEETNAVLTCANCREKLCSHKLSLMRFLEKLNEKRRKGEM